MELQPRSVLARELIADVVRSFGEARLRVTGSSMVPAVWPGDILTVRHRDTAELRPGHIVLYRRQGQLVAHRITCICHNSLTTRGDSLPFDDPSISESEIVGQVVSVVHNGHLTPVGQSLQHRAASFILQRSSFCTRMVLRLGLRLQRSRNPGLSWSN